MRILFAECVPRPLRRYFTGHFVAKVARMGWSGIKNGELLNMADSQFDVLLTVDRGIPFQQNMANRQIAILLLVAQDNKIETLQGLIPEALAALETIRPGQVVHIAG
jgi:uncharacterized protein DUF5615